MTNNISGVTIVIVTYRRNASLKKLLSSLLTQNTNFPLEVILINNWSGQALRKNIGVGLGGLLRKFTDIKILNSSENLGCGYRYIAALYSKYNTICFLDDDVELLSPHFIETMAGFLTSKKSIDIVSAWCAIFRPENIDYFNTDGFNFENHDQEVEVDFIGPGICMFDKNILTLAIAVIPEKYRDVDNVWFSIMPTLFLDSRKYYFPSKGMLRFVNNEKHAMFMRNNIEDLKRNSTNELVSNGYIPILSRSDEKK